MKTVSAAEAISLIPDGTTLMNGGFMGVGTPERLIDELVRQGKRNLTVIANDPAVPGRGIGNSSMPDSSAGQSRATDPALPSRNDRTLL